MVLLSPTARTRGGETSLSARGESDPQRSRQNLIIDAERLVPAHYVCDRLSLSKASFYALLKAGQLEPIVPLKVGPRATRYRLSDVLAFEEAAAQRGAAGR